MFERIRPYVPQTVEIDGARWDICKFLENWRYIKYNPGEHFSAHYDGYKLFDNHSISIFTLNIYLNSDFLGGGTGFYMDC